MNNRTKHKQMTGQMNHQTADPKSNASVFLFFSIAHFLKTILSRHTLHTFGFAPTHKTDPSQNQKSAILPTLQIQY